MSKCGSFWYTGRMDQSLKAFRAAVALALASGDTSQIATPQAQARLVRSPGWTSARRVADIGPKARQPNAAK